MKKVAILIPTYNDSKRLTKCLDALSLQTYPLEWISVYVIDNNSTEDIEAVTSQYAFCQYLAEKKPGAYNARNLGLEAITDEFHYVGFTDADCIPEKNWVELAVSFIGNDSHSAVGGKVKVFAENGTKPNLIEDYEIHFAFPQETYILSDHFAVTANLFTTINVIKKIGPFNADLFSGGDAEWGNRMKLNDVSLMYANHVVVCHPARDRLRKITGKMRRTVGGCYQQIPVNQTMHNSFSFFSLLKGFIPPVRAITRLFNTNIKIKLHRKLCLVGLLIYLKLHNNILKVLYKMHLLRNYERF